MATVSKLDYLKKYMSSKSNNDTGKSKKRRKRPKDARNFKIIDTDVKFNDNPKINDPLFDEFDLEEEKPQVYLDGNTLLSELGDKLESNERQKWAPVSWDSLQERKSIVTGVNAESSPDRSPERLNRRHDFEEIPQSRARKRHDSPDLWPRNNAKETRSPDLSPRGERSRHISPDLSPKRSHLKSSSPDLSPKRFDKRHDSPDLSPNRCRNEDSSSDLSPVRSKRHRSGEKSKRKDLSPDHMSGKPHRSPEFAAERHRRQNDSPDLSPKRKLSKHDLINKRKDQRKQESARSETSPEVVAAGKRSGLQSAKALHEENIRSKAMEDKQFQTMESSLSGKGAATIYRSKSGKKIDLEEEKRKKEEIETRKAEEKVKYDDWHKGLKQKDEYNKKLEEDFHEMSKPLARYQSDKDLDEMLKLQEREEDPMLAFMRKTKLNSKEKKKEKPRYKGPHPPPNRFNLWPGYRWDGVDRSNGFEKKRFSTIAERQSLSNEAYKWSVEDM